MSNKRNCQSCKYYKDGYCENLELKPCYPSKGCGDFSKRKEQKKDTMEVLDKIRAEILEEKECAYADFDKYKVDYLGVDSRYVEDELPYDDFRYGMERCIEIIDKYRNEVDE